MTRNSPSRRGKRGVSPSAILSSHGVDRILIIIDLLNPELSLHAVCDKHQIGIAEARQAWIDSQTEIGMAAASSPKILSAVNTLQRSQKFTDLVGFKSSLGTDQSIPTGL